MAKWEIVKDPCPATGGGKHICQLRAGHARAGEDGEHLTSEWKDGEIVGPLYWDEDQPAETEAATWRNPTDNEDGVEILDLPGGAVGFRMGDADEVHLVIPAAKWRAFLRAAKDGLYDPPEVPQQRKSRHQEVMDRVDERGTPPGCINPGKPAYNLDDEEEAKLARRRVSPGLELRRCACSYYHVGRPKDPTPEQKAQPFGLQFGEGGPLAWAQHRRHVTLLKGDGSVHARGRVLAVIDAPTVQVRTKEGHVIPWRLDMTVPSSTTD